MRRTCVLLAFIALAFLVLNTGWVFAADGKAQGQPFQSLQQQIDQLRAQIETIQLTPSPPASSNSVIRVYDSSETPQYLGIGVGGNLEIFVSELSLFTQIKSDGNLVSLDSGLLYETNVCSGDAFIPFSYAYTLVKIGEGYYSGVKVAPTIRQISSQRLPAGNCVSLSSPVPITSVPAVHLSEEVIPFTLPVVLPLQFILE